MMADEEATESQTVRKIYVLPRELADRVAAFQKAKKLPSEVEAVRRLLDEALLYRDDHESIITRIRERLKTDGMVTSVAKDILVGHPLMESLRFPSVDTVQFELKDGGEFRVSDDGTAWVLDSVGEWQDYDPIPF